MGVLHTPYCIRPIAYAKETLSTSACSMGVLHTPPCIRPMHTSHKLFT